MNISTRIHRSTPDLHGQRYELERRNLPPLSWSRDRVSLLAVAGREHTLSNFGVVLTTHAYGYRKEEFLFRANVL